VVATCAIASASRGSERSQEVADRGRGRLPGEAAASARGGRGCQVAGGRVAARLASSSNRHVIDLVLELAEIADAFQATVSSEEVGAGKPRRMSTWRRRSD